VDFDFAAGTTLAAGGKLVVLPFDLNNPANAARWNSFCTAYGRNPLIKTGFVGGYSSHLNDDGGRVRLERPGDPPRDDPTYTPYLLVEEVHYSAAAPWPTGPAGGGPSLTRQTATLWSNDPASWIAAAAGPLMFTAINQPPTDIGLSANSVPENSPTNTFVGNLTTTDADPGQSWTYALVDDAGGRFKLSNSQLLVANGTLLDYETATSYVVRVRSTDNGSPNLSVEKNFTIVVTDVVEYATVAGRHVFYNRSAFDGNDAEANAADDGAVADKQALLPGQAAAFVNYTSYTRGINGLMVDIAGLWNRGALNAADFTFKVGNDANPAGWIAAPDPLSVTVRSGAGDGGADRITIVWADNAVQQQWLQVTVKATANTGLAAADVFYFGNAIGESGNDPANALVNAQDEAAARGHKTGFAPTDVTNVYDFNRDRRVSASDELTARFRATTIETALRLIDLSGGAALLAMAAPESSATGVSSVSNNTPAESVAVAANSADSFFSAYSSNDGSALSLTQWYWLCEFEQTANRPAKKEPAFLSV
jgi:hypothetical protein